MAMWRCILGVVVLLSVSVRSDTADPALRNVTEVPEKLEGVQPKPDQGDSTALVEDLQDQHDGDEDDSAEDEDSEDEDDEVDEEDEKDEEDASEDDASDQDDHLSVSERLELVNQNLVGDPDNAIEDGDIAVSRAHHVQKRNADPCTQTRPWWMWWRRQCKWPQRKNGKVYVPYVISRDYSASQVRTIKWAFRTFAQKTCIRFVRNYRHYDPWGKKKWKYRNYIYIFSGRGCWSYVGLKKGRQKLSLKKDGCVYVGIIQHELIHALGFHHEHKRSDRDRYVRVLWGNIKKGKQNNFYRVPTVNLGTPYDYDSIMHYRSTAFSKNGRPTLVARRSNATFGIATRMSEWDVTRINRLYCWSTVYDRTK